MKQFLSFVYKEFCHILRDSRTMLILLVMPIIQIILFGFAISTEVKNIRVAVYAPTRNVTTEQIIARFAANPYFTLTRMLEGPQQIETLFRKNQTDLILIFEENFDTNLLHTGKGDIQLITDGTDPNTATLITGYATNILASCQTDLSDNHPPLQIIPEIKLLYNPQLKAAYNFVPGVMGLILMLICAMMTAISIVREKERGTLEVLLVSPMKPIYMILAKAVPYFVLSAVNLTTIILLAVYVLHVPVMGSIFWLAVISLLFILVALSLGLLISTLVKTQVAAMLASGMVLMMPVTLLSGMMFPVESMPPVLQGISTLIPARWYIAAIKKVMIEGLDITYAFKEVMILCLMAIVLIAVSLKSFKNRLE